MPDIIEFLEEEKKSIQGKLVEYANAGNSYNIATANEKLKYINSLINKAIQTQNEEESEDVPFN